MSSVFFLRKVFQCLPFLAILTLVPDQTLILSFLDGPINPSPPSSHLQASAKIFFQNHRFYHGPTPSCLQPLPKNSSLTSSGWCLHPLALNSRPTMILPLPTFPTRHPVMPAGLCYNLVWTPDSGIPLILLSTAYPRHLHFTSGSNPSNYKMKLPWPSPPSHVALIYLHKLSCTHRVYKLWTDRSCILNTTLPPYSVRQLEFPSFWYTSETNHEMTGAWARVVTVETDC